MFLLTPTDNEIGDRGATSLSEALKSNTTLTKLDLSGENKKKTHKRHPLTNHSFLFLFTSTDNNIGGTGATSLSELLKSNTTLTELNLSGEDKRNAKDIHQPITLLFLLSLTDNYIGERGATSLSESLKSNTTLKKLDLWGEDKRNKTQK